MCKLSALIETVRFSYKDEEFLNMAVDILVKDKKEPKDDLELLLQRQENFNKACEFIDKLMTKMDTVELDEDETQFVDFISDALLGKVKRLELENKFLKKENKELEQKLKDSGLK